MMPVDVIEYVETALDDPNIEVKPLDEEMPWLFALQENLGSVNGRQRTTGCCGDATNWIFAELATLLVPVFFEPGMTLRE